MIRVGRMAIGLLGLIAVASLSTGCVSRGEFGSRAEEETYRIEQLMGWAESALGEGLEEPDTYVGGGVCSSNDFSRRSHVRVGYLVDDPEQAIAMVADWLQTHVGIKGMDRTDEPSAIYFRVDGLLSTLKTGSSAFVEGNFYLTFTTGCYES